MALLFVPNSYLKRLRELVFDKFPLTDPLIAQELLREIDKALQDPRVQSDLDKQEKGK